MTLHALTRRHSGGAAESEVPTLRGLQREVDGLFDNFFQGFGLIPAESRTGLLTPKINIAETEKAYELTLEVPGVEEKDIDIQLSGNVLTVQGEKREEAREEGKQFYRMERSYGSFQRSFTLPEGVDEENIQAKSRNGILHITLPKSEKARDKVKKIAVKSH